MIDAVLNGRMLHHLSILWCRIGEPHRRAMAAAFVVGIFAYFIFIAHHLLDNHAFRMPWLGVDEQVQHGRWLGPWVGRLTYGANIPVVMQLFSIGLALTATHLIVSTWKLFERFGDLFLVYTFILIIPYNLANFYYSFMTPLFYVSWIFAAVAFALVDRLSAWRIGLSAIAVVMMMASYQPALSILAVITLSGVIVGILKSERNGERVNDINTLFAEGKLLFARGIAMVLGGGLYLASTRYLPDSSKVVHFESISAVYERLVYVTNAAVRHLFVTQPDILIATKVALSLILLGAVVASLFGVRRSPVKIAVLVVVWPLIVIGSKALFLLSEPGNIYQYRYNGGMIFLYGFSAAILLYVFPRKFMNWIVTSLILFSTILFFQADLVRQLVLLRGQERDLSTINRILYRVESLPDFDSNTVYDFIRVGNLPRYRLQLLGSNGRRWDEIGDGHMDYGEITDLWTDHTVLGLLGSNIRVLPRNGQSATEIREEGLLDDRQVWPHASSVFIDEDRIIVFIR